MKVDLFCKPQITISNAKLITKSTRYFGREFYHYKQTSWPEISYIKLCVTYIHAVTQMVRAVGFYGEFWAHNVWNVQVVKYIVV